MSQTPATRQKGEAVLQFRYQAEWAQWLAQHHAGKTSVLRTHRKSIGPLRAKRVCLRGRCRPW